MKTLIVDCGSSKVPHIEEMSKLFCKDVRIKKLSDLNLNETHEVQCVIVSGAPILLTEQDALPYLQDFRKVLHPRVPLLGICFGHQCLGLSHGAQIQRCEEDRDWQSIETLVDNPLTGNKGMQMQKEDHCECITLPKGFIHLAFSPICSNEAMKHPLFPWYGVQFHPEVSEKAGHQLFANFFNICRTSCS